MYPRLHVGLLFFFSGIICTDICHPCWKCLGVCLCKKVYLKIKSVPLSVPLVKDGHITHLPPHTSQYFLPRARLSELELVSYLRHFSISEGGITCLMWVVGACSGTQCSFSSFPGFLPEEPPVLLGVTQCLLPLELIKHFFCISWFFSNY